MQFETLTYEKIENIAKITMNRPEVRNAENMQMSNEISEAFASAEADNDIKVIELDAQRPKYSSGSHLIELRREDNTVVLPEEEYSHCSPARFTKKFNFPIDMDGISRIFVRIAS